MAEIKKIARETGFEKRIARKIKPEDYLSYLCLESIKGTVSYNDLAAKHALEENSDASRQSYFYRTKKETAEFLKKILEHIMVRKYNLETFRENPDVIRKFKRILIQDSTIIKLPIKLFAIFSGVKNASKSVCNSRIQGIFDLISGRFISFSIDPYSDNDQKVADKINVQKGDLIIRDRGYFNMLVIDNFRKNGADTISRYKHKINFYDCETKQEINLLKKLKLMGSLDINVLMGENKDIKIRVIAMPANEELANTRRMRAKKQSRCVFSSEFLQLLNWNIFITTIEDKNYSFKDFSLLYSLRWRIECIFKTWKSNFSFNKIHTVSENQLNILIRARFIMITLIYHNIFVPLEYFIFAAYKKYLSLLKFMRFISRNFDSFIIKYFNPEAENKLIPKIKKYCSFEKRNRENFNESFALILNDVLLRN